MNNVEKLPKWAQRYIIRIEKDIKYYKKLLELKNKGESNIFILDNISLVNQENCKSLPINSTIYFSEIISKKHIHYNSIAIIPKNDILEIYGGRELIIIPKASNHISLKLDI